MIMVVLSLMVGIKESWDSCHRWSHHSFSCSGCPSLFEDLAAGGIFKILVTGVETHVCVQQTVFDLLAEELG